MKEREDRMFKLVSILKIYQTILSSCSIFNIQRKGLICVDAKTVLSLVVAYPLAWFRRNDPQEPQQIFLCCFLRTAFWKLERN